MKRYIKVTRILVKLIFSTVFLTAINILVLTLSFAQEPAPGSISSVMISPDLRQIVVRGDGVLGKHTAFAFDKPYRLVVDFDSTSLGRIPSKIKLEKPPINEIRLGRMENRARLVIDFGENPVPSYAIERQDNMVVIALGESINSRQQANSENNRESEPKPPRRQTANPKPVPSKKESAQTVERIPAPVPMKNSPALPAPKSHQDSLQAQQAVKKAILTNDLLLIELQDPENPGHTYHLAIDVDLKSHTLRSASMSSLNGKVKRFEISETPEASHTSDSEVSEASPPAIGPRKLGASNTVFESKPMEKPRNVFNTIPYVTSIAPPESQAAQHSLKMEEFKLQVKK